MPLYVSMVISWLKSQLARRRSMPVSGPLQRQGCLFRVDAKAEGNSVAVGGWAPTAGVDGKVCIEKSPWFSLRLTPENAPWAFARGLPAHSISTLEMLASTVAVALLAPSHLSGEGTVAVTGFTDSQVASRVLTRGMTTTYPLCCVVMELAMQLERRGLELSLEWAPREFNREADRLADGNSSGFAPTLRRGTSLEHIPWLVLPAILKAGEAFYTCRKALPTPPETSTKRPKLAGGRLKDREPW